MGFKSEFIVGGKPSSVYFEEKRYELVMSNLEKIANEVVKEKHLEIDSSTLHLPSDQRSIIERIFSRKLSPYPAFGLFLIESKLDYFTRMLYPSIVYEDNQDRIYYIKDNMRFAFNIAGREHFCRTEPQILFAPNRTKLPEIKADRKFEIEKLALKYSNVSYCSDTSDLEFIERAITILK